MLVFAVYDVLDCAVDVAQDLLYHFIGFRCCLCLELYLRDVSGWQGLVERAQLTDS